MKRSRVFLLLGLLWLGPFTALRAGAQDPALATRIESALSPLGAHTSLGVRVVSARTGAPLYEKNPDLSLMPASNMKLLTVTGALARLGPEYRFVTRVLRQGSVNPAGVLDGDLVLQGGGDPVLETAGLEKLAQAVYEGGIREVRGALLADDYRFDAERLGPGWSWDNESSYYSAQISALSVNRNVLQADISPGAAAGEPAEVTLRPVPGYLRLLEQPVTGPTGSETRISLVRERGRNELRARGTIALGAVPVRGRELTMEEPELFAAALFRKLLEERGVRIAGETQRKPAPAENMELARHTSVPLSEIAALLMKPSDNLVAEMLLKEIGYAGNGKGTATAGAEGVRSWLKEAGIETAGIQIHDGSGLSRKDLVTARALTALLLRTEKEPWKEAFLASLPVAGVDGTLRNRLKGTPTEGKVRAKTGTLSRVSGLSGFLTTAGGEPLVFSILLNNYPLPDSGSGGAKGIEDHLVRILAELP